MISSTCILSFYLFVKKLWGASTDPYRCVCRTVREEYNVKLVLVI